MSDLYDGEPTFNDDDEQESLSRPAMLDSEVIARDLGKLLAERDQQAATIIRQRADIEALIVEIEAIDLDQGSGKRWWEWSCAEIMRYGSDCERHEAACAARIAVQPIIERYRVESEAAR
jgi:hypothetical protein